MQSGIYDYIVVSPVTGNTVAKLVNGIADSLVTNCVSQALKGGRTVYLYPTDQWREDTTTILPDGRKLVLKHRKIDLDNIEKLKEMEDVIVMKNYADIYEIIKNTINQ